MGTDACSEHDNSTQPQYEELTPLGCKGLGLFRPAKVKILPEVGSKTGAEAGSNTFLGLERCSVSGFRVSGLGLWDSGLGVGLKVKMIFWFPLL